MRIYKKLLSVLSAVALILLTVSAMGASAASDSTTRFLEPFDDSTFPKAYKVNMTLPQNYDVTEAEILAKGGVFGPNSDKRALAAFTTNKTMKLFKSVYGDSYTRTSMLMKNYVAVDLELIYYFENGFEDFEFLGIAGAGNWAGAFGMEERPPLEFAYSDSADGNWTTMSYNELRDMPAGADSKYCYFRNTNDKTPVTIPTSARFLRVKFLNGADWGVDDKGQEGWVPVYENWACALGYLLVDSYTSPQTGNNPSGGNNVNVTSKPATGTTDNGGTADNSTTSSDNGSTASDTSSVTSSGMSSDDGKLTDKELIDKLANGDDDYYVVTTREIDWKITGIIIAADVLVVGGAVVVLVLLYRKKLKQLGLIEDKKSSL